MGGSNIDIKKLVKEKEFNPLDIGVEVLRQLGYEVEVFYNYTSISAFVRDKKTDRLVYCSIK